MGIDRVLPAEEKFVLQNWGCFCLGVGGIAHAAQRFAPQAQRGVTVSLRCGCGATLTAHWPQAHSAQWTPGGRGGHPELPATCYEYVLLSYCTL